MQMSQALVLLLHLHFAIYFHPTLGTTLKCSHPAVFHKILGLRPAHGHHNNINNDEQTGGGGVLPLYGGSNAASKSREEAVNAKCARLCREDPACYGYLLVFSQNVCYGYTTNRTAAVRAIHYDYIDEANYQLVTDVNVAFFVKTTCLDVPSRCATSKLFPLVTVPGASLIGQNDHQLPRLVTRDECASACFHEKKFHCRSARFVRSFRNNRHRGGLWARIDRAQMGQCFLSRSDRIGHPEAFQRGWDDEVEYLENQCHGLERSEASCSFELYRDTAFVYADDSLIVSDERGCSERCLNEDRFACLGYTYRNSSEGGSRCSLHSDDLTTLGPKAVRMLFDAVYGRRVQCLNLAAQCYGNRMQVGYAAESKFSGRMYLNTVHQNCSLEMENNGTKLLEIPTGNEIVESRCGIRRAFVKDKMFDYLIFSFVYIQQHPLVRTQSDRLLKMGCIHHYDSSNITQLMNNLPMKSTVDFIPHSQSLSFGSTEIRNGTAKITKHVTTELIDVETQAEIFEAALGQLLEMRITSPDPDYDLMPYNLIAYSGEETLELLDDKGCPVDQRLFAGFRKQKTNSEVKLAARFHAFTFPTSTTLNFRIAVKFCYKSCPKVVCFYQ